MPTLQEIRENYPSYNDLSDQELADKLYGRFYSDLPRDQFNSKIGFTPPPPPQPPPPRSTSIVAYADQPSDFPTQYEVGQAQAAAEAAASRVRRGVAPEGGRQLGMATGFMDEAGKGIPILGAYANDTPQARALREQYPKTATGAHIAGGILGSIPAFSLAAPLGIGGATVLGGSLGGGDAYVRGGSAADIGASAALGAAVPLVGAGIAKAAPYVWEGAKNLASGVKEYGPVIGANMLTKGAEGLGVPSFLTQALHDIALGKALKVSDPHLSASEIEGAFSNALNKKWPGTGPSPEGGAPITPPPPSPQSPPPKIGGGGAAAMPEAMAPTTADAMARPSVGATATPVYEPAGVASQQDALNNLITALKRGQPTEAQLAADAAANSKLGTLKAPIPAPRPAVQPIPTPPPSSPAGTADTFNEIGEILRRLGATPRSAPRPQYAEPPRRDATPDEIKEAISKLLGSKP